MVESGGLENRCPLKGPGVRIPLSPIRDLIMKIDSGSSGK